MASTTFINRVTPITAEWLQDVNDVVYTTVQRTYIPENYGAAGDGTTDDTVALQATIDALQALGGGRIDLTGSYLISAELLVSTAPIIFEGRGRRSKIIWNHNGNVLRFYSPFTAGSGVKSLLFRRPGTTAPSAGAVIYNDGSPSLLVDDIFIQDAYNAIYHTGGASGAQSSTYRKIEAWYFTNRGIELNTNVNDVFIECGFLNGESRSGGAGAGIGLRLYNKTEAVTVKSLEVILCSYAFASDAAVYSTGVRPAYSKFTDCFFDSSTNGCLVNNSVLLKFHNCWFSNRPSSGCVVSNTDSVSFNFCDFVNSAEHGLVIQATAVRTRVNGCDAIGNGTTLANTYSGFIVAAGTTDFQITNCTSTSGLAFGTQRNGILVQAGASDRYVIADNLVNGNSTSGVADNGTGVNKRVENNY
jgi:hypothetical protein